MARKALFSRETRPTEGLKGLLEVEWYRGQQQYQMLSSLQKHRNRPDDTLQGCCGRVSVLGSRLSVRHGVETKHRTERDDHARIRSQVRVRLVFGFPRLSPKCLLTSSRVERCLRRDTLNLPCWAHANIQINYCNKVHTHLIVTIMDEHSEKLIRSAFGHNHDLERRTLDASSMPTHFTLFAQQMLIALQDISKMASQSSSETSPLSFYL